MSDMYRDPKSIAMEVRDKIMVAKANGSFAKLVVLGILAGAFIAMGAEVSTLVYTDGPKFVGYGITKIICGLVFSTGLIMVLIAGGELFTGNVMISLSVMEKKARLSQLLRNWTIVYFSNFVGALIMAGLIYYSGLWKGHELIGATTAIKIAKAKVGLSFVESLARGILCNWLVCLAVWMCYGAKDIAGKVMAIVFPITIFIASGYEHCVANMFYIPKAMMLSAELNGGISEITMNGLFNNLIPVTLGNIIGAVLFLSIAYKVAYLREDKKKEEVKKLDLAS